MQDENRVVIKDFFSELGSSERGLSSQAAAERLQKHGLNQIYSYTTGWQILKLLGSQVRSPLTLLLFLAALLSYLIYEKTDAVIILGILFMTIVLGFFQEKGAFNAVQKLLKQVTSMSRVLRDGNWTFLPQAQIVPGDVISLSAGDMIPADGVIFESRDLFVCEASLTGESAGVEKGLDTTLSPFILMGTYVVSGHAKALICKTGDKTQLGEVASHLRTKVPETSFEYGLRQFGYFLMEVTFCLVLLIFVFNQWSHHSLLESFLFALALAVGLTPQLLPAIVSINLSKGARILATQQVIVKKLSSIENLGSMNILCVDKTGTLTEGSLHFETAVDTEGNFSKEVHLFAALNAHFQTGYSNPLDTALCKSHPVQEGWTKLDEIPYDFERKRVSLLLQQDPTHTVIITKGALLSILNICKPLSDEARATLQKVFNEYASKGFRVLAVACRHVYAKTLTCEIENEMTLKGLIIFKDPLKKDVAQTIKKLRDQKVRVKMITGDQYQVALHVAQQLGLRTDLFLLGQDLEGLSDEGLEEKVYDVDVFAEMTPLQKEKIILALRRKGFVVGYLGDGINDVAALHASDVGLAVNSGSDVAKERADIVLLKKELMVVSQGIEQGRKTFANTMKYIFMASSANFGNMFSMAGASLFLPFLPLLPKQILLANLLTDLPEMTIATDSVDIEWYEKPADWDMKRIRRFMLMFGFISSVFDYLTFAVLLYFLKADPALFRTGWFLESVASASMIVLMIRTRRPFWKSRPSSFLVAATIISVTIAAALPLLPFKSLFSFVPLPGTYYTALLSILILYGCATELTKKIFYSKSG